MIFDVRHCRTCRSARNRANPADVVLIVPGNVRWIIPILREVASGVKASKWKVVDYDASEGLPAEVLPLCKGLTIFWNVPMDAERISTALRQLNSVESGAVAFVLAVDPELTRFTLDLTTASGSIQREGDEEPMYVMRDGAELSASDYHALYGSSEVASARYTISLRRQPRDTKGISWKRYLSTRSDFRLYLRKVFRTLHIMSSVRQAPCEDVFLERRVGS